MRHPTLAPLCEAVQGIYHAQAVAAHPEATHLLPSFAWDYAQVGLKDKFPTGRATMPYRITSEVALVSPGPGPVTVQAVLGPNTITALVDPVEVTGGTANAAHHQAIIWSHLESLVRYVAWSTVKQLHIQWMHIHHQSETALDESAVEHLVSAIALGDGEHEGVVPAAIEDLMTCDPCVAVDFLRWALYRVKWRTTYRTASLLGDPRYGLAVRRAIATGAEHDFTPTQVQAAQNLDIEQILQHRPLGHDDNSYRIPSVEEQVMNRVLVS